MTLRPEVQIRPLALAETSTAGDVLARAFTDNPGLCAVISHLDRAARGEALRGVKSGFARASVRFGEARGAWVDGALAGASLVYAPGQYPLSLRAFAEVASGCLQPRLTPALVRFLRIDRWMSKRHLLDPHFYLMVLGVEPALHGKGVGGALLRDLSARADGRGVPCWLETDKEANVPIYERHGYRVVHDERLPYLGDLRMWTMKRPLSGS